MDYARFKIFVGKYRGKLELKNEIRPQRLIRMPVNRLHKAVRKLNGFHFCTE